MAGYTISAQDLKNSTLRKCGEVTDGTSPYDTGNAKDCVIDYLNRAHLAVIAGGNEFIPDLAKPWPWAIAGATSYLFLKPNLNNQVQISCNYNSTTATLSAAPTDPISGGSISIADYWVQLSGRPEWFQVLSHTSGTTSVTLYNGYTDATISGSACNIVNLVYAITTSSGNGILRLVEPFIVYRPQDIQGDEEYKIYGMNETAMLRDYPLSRLEGGVPTRFCTIYKDTTATGFKVRFNKYATDPTTVECRVVQNPAALTDSSSSFPLVPVEHVEILEYIAAYWLCLDKNDDRAEKYLGLAQAKGKGLVIAAEKEQQNLGKMRGKLIPRRDQFWVGRRYRTQDVS